MTVATSYRPNGSTQDGSWTTIAGHLWDIVSWATIKHVSLLGARSPDRGAIEVLVGVVHKELGMFWEFDDTRARSRIERADRSLDQYVKKWFESAVAQHTSGTLPVKQHGWLFLLRRDTPLSEGTTGIPDLPPHRFSIPAPLLEGSSAAELVCLSVRSMSNDAVARVLDSIRTGYVPNEPMDASKQRLLSRDRGGFVESVPWFHEWYDTKSAVPAGCRLSAPRNETLAWSQFDSYVADLLSSAKMSELFWAVAGHPQLICRIPAERFERLVAHTAALSGLCVQLTKTTRDGGFDIEAVRERAHLAPVQRILFECKSFVNRNKKVTVEEVRHAYSVAKREGASKIRIVSATGFTKDAIAEQRRLREPEVVDLVDGPTLASEMLSLISAHRGWI